MIYEVEVSNFDRKKHLKTIREIEKAKTNIEKEPFFKKIARDILKKEKFEKITEGPSPSQFQGVPFDFIAIRNGQLSLIELKGSKDTFNYSGEVQFARLLRVENILKNEKRIKKISKFLLQINLKYSLYQLLDTDFYQIIFQNIDKSVGAKRPIRPIVEDLIKRMQRKGVKLEEMQNLA